MELGVAPNAASEGKQESTTLNSKERLALRVRKETEHIRETVGRKVSEMVLTFPTTVGVSAPEALESSLIRVWHAAKGYMTMLVLYAEIQAEVRSVSQIKHRHLAYPESRNAWNRIAEKVETVKQWQARKERYLPYPALPILPGDLDEPATWGWQLTPSLRVELESAKQLALGLVVSATLRRRTDYQPLHSILNQALTSFPPTPECRKHQAGLYPEEERQMAVLLRLAIELCPRGLTAYQAESRPAGHWRSFRNLIERLQQSTRKKTAKTKAIPVQAWFSRLQAHIRERMNVNEVNESDQSESFFTVPSGAESFQRNTIFSKEMVKSQVYAQIYAVKGAWQPEIEQNDPEGFKMIKELAELTTKLRAHWAQKDQEKELVEAWDTRIGQSQAGVLEAAFTEVMEESKAEAEDEDEILRLNGTEESHDTINDLL